MALRASIAEADVERTSRPSLSTLFRSSIEVPIERILDRVAIDAIVAGVDPISIVPRIDVEMRSRRKLDRNAVIVRLVFAGIEIRAAISMRLISRILIFESSAAIAFRTRGPWLLRTEGIEADEGVN